MALSLIEKAIDDATTKEQAAQTTRRLHDYANDLRNQAASLLIQLEHVNANNPHEVSVALEAAVKACVDDLDKALDDTRDKRP